MQAVFPSTDPVWEPLSQRRGECEVYMQRLYEAVVQRLRSHVRLLRAAEEVSRLGSLGTIVWAILSDGRLRRSNTEMRELQATINESLGWSACPSHLAAAVAELGREGAELTLDYARNLLEQCEKACAWTTPVDCVEWCASSPCAETSLRDDLQVSLDEQPLQRSEAWTGQTQCKESASQMPSLFVWRVYHELCSWLLLPRVDEIAHVWAGLAKRGWDSERVDSLWLRIRGHTQPAARDLAAAWFNQARAGKKEPAGISLGMQIL